MTLDNMIQLIPALSIEERKQLVMAIMESLTAKQNGTTKKRSILDYQGIGASLRDDSVDINEYLHELRGEWDRDV